MTYNLEDGMVPETNMPVRFYLTPNREDGSASILVAEPLDYEITRNFMLRVRAQNVAAVPLAAFTTVYVNVTGKTIQKYIFFLTLPSLIKLASCPEQASLLMNSLKSFHVFHFIMSACHTTLLKKRKVLFN